MYPLCCRFHICVLLKTLTYGMQHQCILARGSDESHLTFWHTLFRQKQKWLSKALYEGDQPLRGKDAPRHPQNLSTTNNSDWRWGVL